jgi:DNA-binding MarR family transcriptional regulator
MRLDSLSDAQAKRLRACPPSAKLVSITLATEGALTQKQLATETMMPQRTVRNALEQLIEVGLVTTRPCPYDARKRMYQITATGRDLEE